MTKELMSLDEITRIESAGFTSIPKIEDELRRLFETAKAAHEWKAENVKLRAGPHQLPSIEEIAQAFWDADFVTTSLPAWHSLAESSGYKDNYRRRAAAVLELLKVKR